jgi:hypothetical protein
VPSRLRNRCRDSRQPCAWPNSANRAHQSWVSQPGGRRDGRYGQNWASSNGGSRRAEAAVKSSAGSRPSWSSRGAPSHGVKTTRLCSVPRTARATTAPRTTRPVALTSRQGKRHLWQEKRATFHLRHDDRVKKGAKRELGLHLVPI